MKIRGQTFDSEFPVMFLVNFLNDVAINRISPISDISKTLKLKSKHFNTSHLYYFDDNYLIKGDAYQLPDYFKETFRKLL